MKFLLLVLALIACTALAGGEFSPKTHDEILGHLQGNNYNVYLVYFYESANKDSATNQAGQDIQNSLRGVLGSNPEFFYTKIDLSDREFSRLGSVVGLPSTPAVLMIVHGKGVWLSGTNANLLADRLRDFIPKFKQASAHHSNPY